MTRLQEVEQLLDSNIALIFNYSKRVAELIGSVRQLEKERDKLTKKNRKLEVVRCKDCVKMNRYDCPFCYIEMKRTKKGSLLDISKLSVQKTTENLSEIAFCDRFICKNCGLHLEDWVKVVGEEYEDGYIDYTHQEYEFKFCPECGAKIVEGGAE